MSDKALSTGAVSGEVMSASKSPLINTSSALQGLKFGAAKDNLVSELQLLILSQLSKTQSLSCESNEFGPLNSSIQEGSA